MQSFLQESELAESRNWDRQGQTWGAAVARILETLCGRPITLDGVSVSPLTTLPPPCLWSELSGPRAVLGLDAADGRTLVGWLAAAEVEPGAALDEPQRDVLREALLQLAQALEMKVTGCGAIEEGPLPAHLLPGTSIEVRLADGDQRLALRLLCPSTGASATTGAGRATAKGGEGQNLQALLDVPLKMMVVLGQARVPLKELLSVGAGSIIELERKTAEPLEILVNGKLFGHGEVVVMDDRFAIRILDVLDAAK